MTYAAVRLLANCRHIRVDACLMHSVNEPVRGRDVRFHLTRVRISVLVVRLPRMSSKYTPISSERRCHISVNGFDAVDRRVDETRSLGAALYCTATAAAAATNYVLTPADNFPVESFAIIPRLVTGALLILMKVARIFHSNVSTYSRYLFFPVFFFLVVASSALICKAKIQLTIRAHAILSLLEKYRRTKQNVSCRVDWIGL